MRLIKQTRLEIQTELPVEKGLYVVYATVPDRRHNFKTERVMAQWNGKIWAWENGASFYYSVLGWIGPLPDLK